MICIILPERVRWPVQFWLEMPVLRLCCSVVEALPSSQQRSIIICVYRNRIDPRYQGLTYIEIESANQNDLSSEPRSSTVFTSRRAPGTLTTAALPLQASHRPQGSQPTSPLPSIKRARFSGTNWPEIHSRQKPSHEEPTSPVRHEEPTWRADQKHTVLFALVLALPLASPRSSIRNSVSPTT